MRKILVISFIIIVFVACKDKKSADENKTGTGKTESPASDPKKDSAAIHLQILGFYEWYSSNYAKLQDYDLYSSTSRKNQPPYKIEWSEVDKLQAYLRSSVPYLGEEFIKNQKTFLQQCDSAFKVDLEDDIPYGFDYDWYTNTQEDPQYLLDELKKSKRWVVKVDGDNATADIKGMYNDNGAQVENTVIKLAMKKEEGVWKISKIGID